MKGGNAKHDYWKQTNNHKVQEDNMDGITPSKRGNGNTLLEADLTCVVTLTVTKRNSWLCTNTICNKNFESERSNRLTHGPSIGKLLRRGCTLLQHLLEYWIRHVKISWSHKVNGIRACVSQFYCCWHCSYVHIDNTMQFVVSTITLVVGDWREVCKNTYFIVSND